MRVSLVTANGDARDGALFVALCRMCPELRIIAPAGNAFSGWPGDTRVEWVRCTGRNWTRQWMHGLEDVIDGHDPDLVHVHNEPWAVTVQRLLRRERPVVIHGAESILASAPLPYRLRRIGTRSALQRAAGYVNWGATGLKAAKMAGLPPTTPSTVIPASPPDPAPFARVPTREPDGFLRICYVGRLIPMKGVDDLLKGIALTRDPSRISVSVVGSGSEEGRLRSLAQSVGVRARFDGPLDADGVHQVLADSDVLAVPSKDTRTVSEQWGRVVVEAMMTGRSVLASDAGELPNLVGHADWIFRQNDPESLGRSLDVLLANPSLIATRAEAAYKRAQLFHPEVLAAQLIDFWGVVLADWRERNDRDDRK